MSLKRLIKPQNADDHLRLTITTAAAQINPDDPVVIYGDLVNGGKDVQIRLETSADVGNNGWVGFGLGSKKMQGSDLAVAWVNSTGQVVINRRFAIVHRVSSAPIQDLTVIQSLSGVKGSTFAVTFTRPVGPTPGSNSTVGVLNSLQNMIWSYNSADKPGDDVSTRLAKHDDYGQLGGNLLSPGASWISKNVADA
ncbi:hypothetical protein HDV05_001556 [Chytridiales sp. JEL 0842]|nr:hypothetical protein HDV05_001556 [Chytridiales sp. JEL 0842]